MKRRTFIQSTLAAGAATLVLPRFAFGATFNNETLRVAQIGTGRMGHGDMQASMTVGLRPKVNARVVAVCDVDSKRAEHAKGVAESFYKEQGESHVEVKVYEDFRDVLARDDIDAVNISTPEAWHALIGIAAANAGKHIYMQKPMTYSIGEGKALVKAVRANGVTLQVGTQQRSSVYFHQVCTIIRNNWLGKLKRIEVGVPQDKGEMFVSGTEQVPSNLNYDLWLGPREPVPYFEGGVHSQEKIMSRPGWLQREQYCLGMITGWGTHMYDIAQWAMGEDFDGGPVRYKAKGDFPDRGLFNVHVGYDGEAVYRNGVKMTSSAGSAGVKFITEDGWAYCNRGNMKCSNEELLRRRPKDSEVSLYKSKNHMEDFLTSARAGKDPICPVEVGHRSNTICVLHHASMKLKGKKIKWDVKRESIKGNKAAKAVIDVPMREPWTI
ncbi:Gfo/Idh/MocA family protein [Pelagicoccus mobilis]|uniref:Gfo/Idh/MocA family oxidoreductase n=1 Tax=Pelagicoccus mobilis TaxID=415221 RepID=A0A934RS76_9BACT|nr:Gfo/Idh/MocA family oxidoreductase [Pelagicoccus mobilis]MBK1875912.1 Gfo/Idh/MocA family oxidoreductase [Pelagicoccus mobilis]